MKISATVIFMILTLTACLGLKRYRGPVDLREKFVWIGSSEQKSYLLSIDGIDKNEGVWFNGKIIIDLKDTLYLRDFEKGNNHPTRVLSYNNDTLDNKGLGHIFFWAMGLSADSVLLRNHADSLALLPIYLTLYKTAR